MSCGEAEVFKTRYIACSKHFIDQVIVLIIKLELINIDGFIERYIYKFSSVNKRFHQFVLAHIDNS